MSQKNKFDAMDKDPDLLFGYGEFASARIDELEEQCRDKDKRIAALQAGYDKIYGQLTGKGARDTE